MPTTTVTIPLAEVAAQVGHMESARYWIQATGGRIIRDWAGREAVNPGDAERAVQGHREAARENAALQHAYDQELRRWEAERQRVMSEAFEKAALEARSRFLSMRPSSEYAEGGYLTSTGITVAPGSFHEAQAAAQAALEKHEKKNPKPTLGEFEKKWRKGRR